MESEQPTGDKWLKRFLDVLDEGIAVIKQRTTQPLVKLVRGFVFGSFGLVGAILVFVLLLVAIFRGLNELLDIWWSRDVSVWASYFILGGVFLAYGGRLLRRRHPQE